MELTRKSILSKTHYGLNIYAFILRQYYPNEITLSIVGRTCKSIKNPFNNGKSTLLIEIKNNCAIHTDLENSISTGDVFDFAELHFKISSFKLLEKLNEVLYLRIKSKNDCDNDEPIIENKSEQKNKKIILPKFSFFKNPISNVNPLKVTDLLEVYEHIKGNDYNDSTVELQKIKDLKKARKFKAFNFDYVTFSGIFSKRNEKHLKKNSGLLTIDFDHISNISILKEQLIKDEYFETELLFASPSGDGLKWIIPIELTKVKHQDYFKAVANYIQHKYSVKIDGSGKDISRACFLPYDPNVFINPKYL